MAIVGVSITKRISFRDSTQEFSNVYHYDNGGLTPSATEAAKIINHLADKEKTFHSVSVTFVRGRCWSAGGTIEQNEMITEVVLSGTGASAGDTTQDRERAVLVQWPAGKDSRGKPVRLKKWFHCCGAFAGVVFSGTILANIQGLSATQRNDIQTAVAGLNPLMVDGLPYELKAASGREVEGDPVAHKYFEHHQLGDQWRG